MKNLKRVFSLLMAFALVLTVFVSVSAAEAMDVVILFDDCEDESANWTYYNTLGGKFITVEGTKAYAICDFNATQLVNSYDANTGSTSAYVPRAQYNISDIELVKGAAYTLSYKYNYQKKTGIYNSNASMGILNVSSSAPITAATGGWSSNTAKTQWTYYITGSYATFRSVVLPVFTPTEITGGDKSLLSNIQIQLNGFNGSGKELQTKTKEVMDKISDSYTKADAIAELQDYIASGGYEAFVDDLKLTVNTTDYSTLSVTSDNATVKVNGVTTTDSAIVANGYTSVIRAVADEGYKVTGISINGDAKELSADGTVSAVITADSSVAVTAVKVSTVTFNPGAYGVITYNGTDYSESTSVSVIDNSVSFSVSANDGYFVKSVKAGGTELVAGNGQYTVFGIGDTTVISVEYIAETDTPAIKTFVLPVTGTYESENSILVYGKLYSGKETVTDSGYKLSAGDTKLDLSNKGNMTSDGVFGIRVYGAALVPGSYILSPYYTYGGNTTEGEGQTVIIE